MALGTALTKLTTEELENTLRRLHRGELPCPITTKSLHHAGLSYLVDKADFLLGLDERAARAVLIAVLAERKRAG